MAPSRLRAPRLVGSMTALITPFKGDAIDEKAFQNLCDWQIKQGTRGLIAVGVIVAAVLRPVFALGLVVALAGGYGTIEEVMEMVTWNQLGIHALPIVLVNIDGYWDGLLQWVRNAVREGYIGERNADILVEVKGTGDVVEALKGYRVSEERFQLDWTI